MLFVGDSSITPVVAGVLTGVLVLVLFSAYFPSVPSNSFITIGPADYSPNDESDNVQFERRVKLDGNNPWEMSFSPYATSDRLLFLGIERLPLLGASPPYDIMNELIFFTKSDKSGVRSGEIKYLTNNTKEFSFSGVGHLYAVNNNLLYITWINQTESHDYYSLLLTKSNDGGDSFTKPENIANHRITYGYNDLAASKDGQTVYVIWSESEQSGEAQTSAISFRMSHDAGENFEPVKTLFNDIFDGEIYCPQLILQESLESLAASSSESGSTSSSNQIYIVWQQYVEKSGIKVMFTASHDNGATFDKPVVIKSAYSEEGSCPQMSASNDGSVYLMWTETKILQNQFGTSDLVPDTDIFIVASKDNGRAFGEPINLSKGIGAFTGEARMAVSEDGRNVYAVWRDTIPITNDRGELDFYGYAEIILVTSEDGGKTFGKPVNLSNNSLGSYGPEIAIHGNNVYVIWLESSFPSNVGETSFRMSNDGGKTFGRLLDNITGTIKEPVSRPSILTSDDGSKLYIIWSETPYENDINIDTYLIVGQKA